MLHIIKSNCWLQLALLLAIPQLSEAQGSLETVQEIRKRGEVRVASLRDPLYPFSVLKGGHWSGYEIDLAQLVADTIGVKLVWDASYGDTAALVDALKQRKADLVIARVKRDLAIAQQVNYSLPYLTLNFVIVTNRLKVLEKKPSDDRFQSMSQLSLRIGTINSSTYINNVSKRFPNAKVETFTNIASLIEALDSGKIDAVFCDEVEARKMFVDKPERGLYFGYFALPELRSEVAAIVDWPDTNFAAWLNLLLEPVVGKTRVDQLFLKNY
jgi:polar amino acid transport system substrate-binding protein